MKTIRAVVIFFLAGILFSNPVRAQEDECFRVNNPVTTEWIKTNLSKESPKLILTPPKECKIRQAITAKDPLISAYYNMIAAKADDLLDQQPLERELTGRRLLGVSREAVTRISTLAMVYRFEKDPRYLEKLEEEMNAVCNFTDWNPSHFLDVGEMALAVALGLDWCGEWLFPETVTNARNALKEKALLISLDDEDYNWWINSQHNWNQVCHGGISAAALVIADEEPELAAKIISRAIEKLPLAMESYSPDGAYPEGPSYWDYGTSYNLMAISMFESAFGTDFGMSEYPGFLESGVYRMVVIAPSGSVFNYSDAGDPGRMEFNTCGNLAWFAQKTGNGLFLNKENLLQRIINFQEGGERYPQLSGAILVWLSQFEEKQSTTLPVYWKADGWNPIAILGSELGENRGFYLGVKGGSASVNHANLDAGSFIFELDGVRWSVDPGNQGYHELEETIGASNLWDQSQDSYRWNLLTKGNLFHSTLTVNDARHNVTGFAPISGIIDHKEEKSVVVDLDEIFEGQIDSAFRTFTKVNDHILRIEDRFRLLDNTESVTWVMITRAEVQTMKQGAMLKQDEQILHLMIIEPAAMNVSVVSLDPPPLPYDKTIPSLKRIEIRIPAYVLKDMGKPGIVVELSSFDPSGSL
jgi:hypothetical protein